MGNTSAAELFHLSSKWEGHLHSGNLSLRQQMHQTETNKTTLSANHKNITGIFIKVDNSMKISTLKTLNPVCVDSSQKSPYCKHTKYL
jgi:hypothetical protein